MKGSAAEAVRYPWVLLDADGTLFDYAEAERVALGAALAEVGVTLDVGVREEYRRISGVLWGRFESGDITAERLRVERFEALFSALAIGADAAVFAVRYLELLGEQDRLLPDAAEVVAALRGRARLALATNGFSAVQRSRLARSALRDAFDEIVISEEVGFAKPRPEFFAEALGRLGNPPLDRVLMVGDSLSSDIAGGRAAGIDTCWYTPGAGEPLGAGSDEVRPTYRIGRLPELVAIVATGAEGPGSRSSW